MALVAAGVALLVAPREVNGDGIGYLKAAQSGALYPGHLGYAPLLSAAISMGHAVGTGTALRDGVGPGRLLSALCAGIACAAVGAFVARRTGERRRGVVAALGMLTSAGTLLAGCDIESYAPALAALGLTLLFLGRRDPALAGATLALAILMHVENALFVLPALLLCADRRGQVGLLLVAAVVLAAAYAAVGLSPATIGGATHGFHYPLRPWTPLLALWGAARALVYVPYLFEASRSRVVVSSVLAFVAAGALIVLARRREGPSPLPARVVLAWALPYSVVALGFFASDPERWVFLLPLAWTLLAARAAPRTLALAAGAILLANLVLWVPRARDTTSVDRARAEATRFVAGDLVISPGHGWDEQLPLVAEVEIVPFPLVFYAAAEGGAVGLARALDAAIGAAHARGARVLTVRFGDADDPSGPLGYKELAAAGLDREEIASLLAARGLTPR